MKRGEPAAATADPPEEENTPQKIANTLANIVSGVRKGDGNGKTLILIFENLAGSDFDSEKERDAFLTHIEMVVSYLLPEEIVRHHQGVMYVSSRKGDHAEEFRTYSSLWAKPK
jgi:hypothetical protein